MSEQVAYPMPDHWEPYTLASVVDLVRADIKVNFPNDTFRFRANQCGKIYGIKYCVDYTTKFGVNQEFKFKVNDGDSVITGDTIFECSNSIESAKVLSVVIGMITAMTTISNGMKAPKLGHIARRARSIMNRVGARPVVFNCNHSWDFIANTYIASAFKSGAGREPMFSHLFDNILINRERVAVFNPICKELIRYCESIWNWELFDKAVKYYEDTYKTEPMLEFLNMDDYICRSNVFPDFDTIVCYWWSIDDLIRFRAEYPNKKIYIGYYYSDRKALDKVFAYEFSKAKSLYDGLVINELFSTFKFTY